MENENGYFVYPGGQQFFDLSDARKATIEASMEGMDFKARCEDGDTEKVLFRYRDGVLTYEAEN